MPTLTYTRKATIDGISYLETTSAQENGGGIIENIRVPKGKVGTLTTHTSDSIGILTVSTGHGFYVGLKFDLYWDGGARFGCEVTAVTSTTITFGVDQGTSDFTTGDNVPSTSTSIIASPVVLITIPAELCFYSTFAALQFTGNSSRCTFHLNNTSDGNFNTLTLEENNIQVYETTNLLNLASSENANNFYVSNGSSSVDARFNFFSLYDATQDSSS